MAEAAPQMSESSKLARWLAKSKDRTAACPTSVLTITSDSINSCICAQDSACKENLKSCLALKGLSDLSEQNAATETSQKVQGSSKLARWLTRSQQAAAATSHSNGSAQRNAGNRQDGTKLSRWIERSRRPASTSPPAISPAHCSSQPPSDDSQTKLQRWLHRVQPSPSFPATGASAPHDPAVTSTAASSPSTNATINNNHVSDSGETATAARGDMPAAQCINGVVTTGFKAANIDEGGKVLDADSVRKLLPSATSTDGEQELRQDSDNGYHRIPKPDGSLYTGWIRNGVPSGQGSYRWADGGEYHGEFAAGRLHGAGSYFFPDGAVVSCQFDHDCPRGEGTYVDPEKRVYTVVYDGTRPLRDGAAPASKREEPTEPYRQVGV